MPERRKARSVSTVPASIPKSGAVDLGKIRSALALQCLPLGSSGREEAWAAVDKAIREIERSGLSYTVGPFETVIEGPLDALWAVAKAAHRAVLEAGVGPVASYMKLWSGEDLGSSNEKTRKYRRRGH